MALYVDGETGQRAMLQQNQDALRPRVLFVDRDERNLAHNPNSTYTRLQEATRRAKLDFVSNAEEIRL